MTKLIAYLRVSTSDQAENGVGMDAQLHACHTYAKRDGMEITQVFRDEGIKVKLNRQYEAIESGVINLQDVGGRIRDLKFQREQIEERLDELKQNRTIPLHFFKDESISEFQQTIKDLFLGENSRPMTKRYLQLFIEKLVIKLPKVDIVGKSDMILAVLENKKAVRTDGVLTAVDAWLPSTDSNRGQDG